LLLHRILQALKLTYGVNIVGQPVKSISRCTFHIPKYTKDEYVVIPSGTTTKTVVDLSKKYDLSDGGLFNVTIYGSVLIRDDPLSLQDKRQGVGAGPLEIFVDKTLLAVGQENNRPTV
jgi:hypothetical protein